VHSAGLRSWGLGGGRGLLLSLAPGIADVECARPVDRCPDFVFLDIDRHVTAGCSGRDPANAGPPCTVWGSPRQLRPSWVAPTPAAYAWALLLASAAACRTASKRAGLAGVTNQCGPSILARRSSLAREITRPITSVGQVHRDPCRRAMTEPAIPACWRIELLRDRHAGCRTIRLAYQQRAPSAPTRRFCDAAGVVSGRACADPQEIGDLGDCCNPAFIGRSRRGSCRT
jgi:hypothetical protein